MRGLALVLGVVVVGIVVIGSAACGTPPPAPQSPATQPAQPPSPDGHISFDVRPDGATIIIDGEERGTVAAVSAAGGLTLPKGVHRIEIRMPGHHPYRVELNLGSHPEALSVELRPMQ